MIGREQAEKILAKQQVKNGRALQLKRVGKLTGSVCEIGRNFLGRDKKNKSIKDWQKSQEVQNKAFLNMDALKPSQRKKLFKALFPAVSGHVENAFEMLKSFPYQVSYTSKAFRTPGNSQSTAYSRGRWLDRLSRVIDEYNEDVVWLAQWASYIDIYSGSLGILFASVIDSGVKEADEVYQILIDSANGEHEIGQMSRHVIQALLSCSRPDAWEYVEKLLLAAQRQEGLRQQILESVDLAHPQAFKRMLRLILDENLARFSSVARAANVWFGINYDSVNAGKTKEIIETTLLYLENEDELELALKGDDVEKVYLALWATAFEDAYSAIDKIKVLLKHPKEAHRFTALWMLKQLELIPAIKESLTAFEDYDPRCAFIPIVLVTDGEYFQVTGEDVFGKLQEVLERLPEKKKTFEPLLWPWLDFKIGKVDAANAMVYNIDKNNPERILPYVSTMDSDSRSSLIYMITNERIKLRDTKDFLLKFVGDKSSNIREVTIKYLKDVKITTQDAEILEPLLTRKAGDLRRGVLGLLMNQSDKNTLASSERLISSKNKNQRLAGLELLQLMCDAGRKEKDCQVRAQEYQSGKKTITDDEQKLLQNILKVETEKLSFENALGLCDLSKRTKSQPLDVKNVKIVTPQAEKAILELDKLIHENREHTFKTEYSDEKMLANAGLWFPHPNYKTPLEEDVKRLPLSEVWIEWWQDYAKTKANSDGFDLLRLQGLSDAPFMDYTGEKAWKCSGIKHLFGNYTISKAKYPDVLHRITDWLVRCFPEKNGADFLLNAAIKSFSLMPKGFEKRWLRKEYSSPYKCWFGVLHSHYFLNKDFLTGDYQKQFWYLMKWIDEPVSPKGKPLDMPRSRPAVDLLLKTHLDGCANDADVYDHLIGLRKNHDEDSDRFYYRDNFDSLRELTKKKYDKPELITPRIQEIIDDCRNKVIEIEIQRGDTPTIVSEAATDIKSVFGIDHFISLIKALGKGTLIRGWSSGSKSKNSVLSGLIRVSFPHADEDYNDFAAKVKEAGITEKRLVEVGVYAPQWAKMVEKFISWKGYEEAVWWIHAHTKDDQWSVDEHVRHVWTAETAERTPLKSDDLLDGAVDVEWFNRVYKSLKVEKWEQVYAAAKYTSGGAGHKRAQLFADAMLGKVKVADLTKRINEKRHQDTVRALGLVPLKKGKSKEKDVLERYQQMQEFIRTSRQFGSQRQASEKRASMIGQENLARNAGYADPVRLQWAMEAHAVADLADGPIEVQVDETKVSLNIDEFGEVGLTVDKNGKILKSVPAKIGKNPEIKNLKKRKTELKRQASRIRINLEQMMCRGDGFTGKELMELMIHPLISPMLSRLVFIGEGIIGYPQEKGNLLVDCHGNKEPVKKTEQLRIAHPMDLLETGNWHLWQRDCFSAERVQPFKQIFRELYALTQNEKKDTKGTQRYSGHQVNPRQALALLGLRGWVSKPEEGVFKTYHQHGLTAWVEFEEYFHTPAEVEGLTLDRISFSMKGEYERVKINEIPSILFSEVMRDMDLVVSVAHRGGVDPEASASTIEMRSSILQETLQVLSLENVRVKDSHAFIKGQHAEYSIHLGSAVTHVVPGGELLVVPIHSQHRGRLFLPFADDDPKTAEVMTKVLLFARDKDIKDVNILDQIRYFKK